MNDTVALDAETCGACGNPLEMIERFSISHGRKLRFASACEPCRVKAEVAAETHRLNLLIPKLIRKAEIPDGWEVASLNLDVWPELTVDSGNLDAVERLQKWISGTGSLYVYGATGCGKTTLALAALMDLLRRGTEGLFLSEMDLEADLHRGWSRDLIHRAWEAPVLVLDDIGSRELDARILTVYRDLFDRRSMRRNLRTLVTGQLPPSATKGQEKSLMNVWKGTGGKVREDIAGRLKQILGGNAVEVSGFNRRIAGGQK